jgi:hypothetical protein
VGNPDNSVDVRTFSDLLKDVDSVASELRTQCNFGVGDKALLISPNNADYFTAVTIFNGLFYLQRKIIFKCDFGLHKPISMCMKFYQSIYFYIVKKGTCCAASGWSVESS